MPNPAERLTDLFDSWNVATSNISVSETRGVNGTLEGWDHASIAVRLLDDIRLGIGVLEESGIDVAIYEEAMVEWYAGAFSQAHGWTAGGTGPAIPGHARTTLVGLGHLLSLKGFPVPELSTEARQDIRAGVDAVRELLLETPSMPSGARDLIMALLRQVEAALDDVSTRGELNLLRLSSELGAVLLEFGAAVTEPEERAAWYARAGAAAFRLFKWGGKTAATPLLIEAAEHVVKAITSG